MKYFFCFIRAKVFYHFIILIFTIVVFSCASSSVSVPAQGIYVPADIAGAAHAGDTETQAEYDLLEYAGVKWTLRTFDWHILERSKGEWDFSFPDSYINGLNDAEIKIIGLLAYGNRLYNNAKKNRFIDSSHLPYFLEYARQMAVRYKGKVDAWCIWNEPNLKYFWRGTQEDFFELTRETARVIKEIDSEVIIIGGSFNRIPFMPKKFIRGLFESGAMEQVDIIAFHPYELNPARSQKAYNDFKNIVSDYRYENKIWVTETGYPTGGLYPHRVSEKRFPEYIIKTWVLLAASGTEKIIWYQMHDPQERKWSNSEHFFGLTQITQEQTYKSKGLEAFRLCANYISDSVCFSLGDNSAFIKDGFTKNLRAFLFERIEGSTLVIWNEGMGSKKVVLNLPGTEHLQHNIVTGESFPVSQDVQIKAGRNPVFITWRNEK